MDIAHIGETRKPQRHQEVHRLSQSMGAERFASTQATTRANRFIHQPVVTEDNLEISEEAQHTLAAPYETSGSKRADQLVNALKAAWGHVGQEPARQDGQGQRRSA